MAKIAPCLWFDTQALEAAKFYCSIFKRSKVGRVSYYGEGAPMPKGTILTVEFKLDGQPFLALNGGPQFKFSEAISLMVDCATQKDVDRMWEKLSAGGEQSVCGWLKDKYGLSWQVVPTIIGKMMADKNSVRQARVFQAVMRMKKPIIADLKKAYAGR